MYDIPPTFDALGDHVSCEHVRMAMWASAGALALVAAGCSSSSSGSSASISQPAPTSTSPPSPTGSTPTSTAPAEPGISFSGSTALLERSNSSDFDYQLTFQASLGSPTQTTSGEQPPYVAVDVPVSGSGSLTNTSTGYSAQLSEIPLTTVYALYKVVAGSPLCYGTNSNQTQPVPSNKGSLCPLRVTTLAPECSEWQSLRESSLPANQPVTLASWGGESLTPVEEKPPANVIGMDCEASIAPGGSLTIGGLTSAGADAMVTTLSAPPAYWALVYPADFQKTAGTQRSDVVASQPAGLATCIDGAFCQ
jgi:hypothetical protein